MEYKQFGNTIVARLDKGEEILESLKKIALENAIHLASVSALGAVSEFSAGAFDLVNKVFIPKDFAGNYEIITLNGTITEMDEKPYLHMHICAAGEDCIAIGGHLTRGIVSNTCEIVIQLIDGCANRKRNEETGLTPFYFVD